MLAINLTSGATTANTAVPFTKDLLTNSDISVNTLTNSIQIKTPGYYEIAGQITVQASGGVNTGIGIYADGTQIGNSSYFLAGSASEQQIIPIYTIFEVDSDNSSDYATLQLMPVGAPVVISGEISIKQIV